MGPLLPQTRPARIKLGLSCLITTFALFVITGLPNWAWHLLPESTATAYSASTLSIVVLGVQIYLAPLAQCFLILALSMFIKADVFAASGQRIAAIALQCTALAYALEAALNCVTFIDYVYMEHISEPGTTAAILPNWFNSFMRSSLVHRFNFAVYYLQLVEAIALLIIFTPPALRLSNWVPRRQKIARIIFLSFAGLLIAEYALDWLYQLNPMNIAYARDSGLGALLDDLSWLLYWLDALIVTAGLVFAFKLRIAAPELAADSSTPQPPPPEG